MKTILGWIASVLMHLKMMLIQRRQLRELQQVAAMPDEHQAQVLLRILQANQHTGYGKLNGFESIRTIDEYRRRIPIQTYEELRPFIERQIATGETAITSTPALLYAQTSGTTGKPKYVPILQETINSYRAAQGIFSQAMYRDVPDIFSGKILAIVSPAIEGHLDNGIPYGSMSGLVYQNMPALILSRYVLSPLIFELTDYDSKYLLIAAFALAEKRITCIATANPSTFLRIAGVVESRWDNLIECIEKGSLEPLALVCSQSQRQSLSALWKARPRRATQLRALRALRGSPTFADFWPDVRAAVTWTSGNCALLLTPLRKLLLPETAIVEMGYLSSEFRGTITIDCIRNLGLPTLQDHFFEFSEIALYDKGERQTLLLGELEQGKQYYIIVTALHGLYRYFINDIVEVTGRYQKTPTLRFVQKGKGVTNLSGEKVYESQVIEALQRSSKQLGVSTDFFIMLADPDDFSYTLYLECAQLTDPQAFEQSAHQTLCLLNLEYAAKTQSGRVRALRVKRLRTGTAEVCKAFYLNTGQREGQFKVVTLQYRADMKFNLEAHVY